MNKVKIQDIADKAGLSRNTVSKIFNGKYNGPVETKEKVIQLAMEMNYKEYGQLQNKISDKMSYSITKNILILTKGDIINSYFFAHIVNEIQKMIEGEGYNLLLSNIRDIDIETMQLPSNVRSGLVDGIVCMELFDRNYIEKLIATEIPIIFVEFYYDAWNIEGNYDIIMMNNEFYVNSMVKKLIKDGSSDIGFVGDYHHCRGFYERYMGYVNALRESGIPVNPNNCMTVDDGDNYFNVPWIIERIQKMEKVPDAFVCANDAIAVNIVKALKQLHYIIPDEVQIISFDDIPDAVNISPTLTTVRVFREDLGRCAFENLLARINTPNRKRQIIYVDTEIVVRESTRKSIVW
ncbi:LacI family DNA-binding transcriptional regulator [Anaerocolumna sp. MB42-C2]|uniref:LacI family DNA-binding transcriptional regulator n=1 Tax=Anaerocolumna sp. MB42-C2 TaxID=3070997 RepID=UPI0027E159CA|nr:LacI family DNA-binding transcriptional regulator [Anaerocolumna sp. MB42-C2]WMJ86799.1 LacI family DNA-binding transcriptional regulator [Anaerocolumna sp. MB42-C2]